MFEVGQKVAITRLWDRLETFGHSTVVTVSRLRVVLADGTQWRASDGYVWGEKPCKHFGRAGQKHIRPASTKGGPKR